MLTNLETKLQELGALAQTFLDKSTFNRHEAELVTPAQQMVKLSAHWRSLVAKAQSSMAEDEDATI